MEEIDFISIAIRIIITWACYMLIPLILKNLLHKNYNEKQALKLSIINSIVVGLLFFVVESFITKNQKINILPAFFWGFINYNMLKPSKKTLQKMKRDEKKNLQDFIKENIESQNQYSNSTNFNTNDENNDSNKLFCKHCGKKHDTEAKYCEYCGKKI